MATNITNQPSKMQTRLDAAASGLSSINLTTLNSMMILGAMMAKAEVITKLKSLSAVYAAATNAKQAFAAAVKVRKAGQQQTMAFYDALVMALKLALGPTNEGMLPSFGVALPKEPKQATVETKTIAKAKAAATREARGTKGKQQRLAITAQPGMSLQVLGPDGQPVGASASGSNASTSTASTPASSSSPSTSPVSSPESSSTAPKSTP